MNILDTLRTSLLDLLWELRESDIKLIIGGGYGIFLKAEYVRSHNIRTLLASCPKTRSTSDLDLFLRPHLLIHPQQLKPLAIALNRLGYTVVPGAEKYQFAKPGAFGSNDVKIDLLTGPLNCFSGTTARSDSRRIQPRPSIGLHAHPVNEAPALEDNLVPLTICGILSTGTEWEYDIALPHPYTFLMMKLFAFNDRHNDESKEFGRYHALDLYTIVATTTEPEWNEFPLFRTRLHNHPYTIQAAAIVAEHFSAPTHKGIIRLRESRYFRPDLQVDTFMSILRESFPGS